MREYRSTLFEYVLRIRPEAQLDFEKGPVHYEEIQAGILIRSDTTFNIVDEAEPTTCRSPL